MISNSQKALVFGVFLVLLVGGVGADGIYCVNMDTIYEPGSYPAVDCVVRGYWVDGSWWPPSFGHCVYSETASGAYTFKSFTLRSTTEAEGNCGNTMELIVDGDLSITTTGHIDIDGDISKESGTTPSFDLNAGQNIYMDLADNWGSSSGNVGTLKMEGNLVEINANGNEIHASGPITIEARSNDFILQEAFMVGHGGTIDITADRKLRLDQSSVYTDRNAGDIKLTAGDCPDELCLWITPFSGMESHVISSGNSIVMNSEGPIVISGDDNSDEDISAYGHIWMNSDSDVILNELWMVGHRESGDSLLSEIRIQAERDIKMIGSSLYTDANAGDINLNAGRVLEMSDGIRDKTVSSGRDLIIKAFDLQGTESLTKTIRAYGEDGYTTTVTYCKPDTTLGLHVFENLDFVNHHYCPCDEYWSSYTCSDADPCASGLCQSSGERCACAAGPTEVCNNSVDDDGDGYVDCCDNDCTCPSGQTCDMGTCSCISAVYTCTSQSVAACGMGTCPSGQFCSPNAAGTACECTSTPSSTCIPDGANGICPDGCEASVLDPDCNCLSGNGICGIGCTNPPDTDCPASPWCEIEVDPVSFSSPLGYFVDATVTFHNYVPSSPYEVKFDCGGGTIGSSSTMPTLSEGSPALFQNACYFPAISGSGTTHIIEAYVEYLVGGTEITCKASSDHYGGSSSGSDYDDEGPTIIFLNGFLTMADGTPIEEETDITVTISNNVGTEIWQHTFEDLDISDGIVNLPLGDEDHDEFPTDDFQLELLSVYEIKVEVETELGDEAEFTLHYTR